MASFLERFHSFRLSGRQIFKSTPRTIMICIYAAIFLLFASINVLFLLMSTAYLSPLEIFLNIVIPGVIVVGFAAVLLSQRYWLIPVLIISQILFSVFGAHSGLQLIAPGSAMHRQLEVLGTIGIVSVLLGCVLFSVVIRSQGARYFRAHNELAMAAEIHRALVPPIHKTDRSFEIYGISVPSGEVGGDLVDVAGDGDSWTGYVADVSGHGVSAGLLMAMFKTAVRTGVKNAPTSELLGEVHRALYPLKTPNMFATVGALQWTGTFNLTLAGHLPLLHYVQSCGEVREYPALDPPWGILADQTFHSMEVVCQAGDILILLTDGLTEVVDRSGKEMGIAPLKEVLCRSASQKLPELFNSMRATALNFGKQHDDQTMLIVRCL
ncbi:MAG TPA: PP2C family protein-serine/threonine phosphatase [Candidatus Angelobacter sp.]|nr:PP2C family protein-serine/threonine phosphatase [Candidatus Angelobacter sp.]